MDTLNSFGVFALAAMLVCYALANQSRLFVLGFVGSCFLVSIYGFLLGEWPLGVIEAICAAGVARRFRKSS
jgi:hypothetical protein